MTETVTERTLSLPRMPALWDKADVCVSHKSLAGSLAHWAVSQSPYTVPENLGAAVEQFMEHWGGNDYLMMTSANLKTAIRRTIDQCPLIVAWNTPKIEGAVNPGLGVAFVSRYESINSDYDFIDLDALAHNVSHELTLWSQVEHAQDATHEAA
jgi:hypothetical protein